MRVALGATIYVRINASFAEGRASQAVALILKVTDVAALIAVSIFLKIAFFARLALQSAGITGFTIFRALETYPIALAHVSSRGTVQIALPI